jgi:hypothetical protein
MVVEAVAVGPQDLDQAAVVVGVQDADDRLAIAEATAKVASLLRHGSSVDVRSMGAVRPVRTV